MNKVDELDPVMIIHLSDLRAIVEAEVAKAVDRLVLDLPRAAGRAALRKRLVLEGPALSDRILQRLDFLEFVSDRAARLN